MECRVGRRPESDSGYLEMMAKVIFRSGLGSRVVEAKWPAFRKAFHEFDPDRMARIPGRHIDRMLHDESLIRNPQKLRAIVENAREFLRARDQYGSFARYLRKLAAVGEDPMCRELSKRFRFLGKSTTVFFLRSVGEQLPELMSRRTIDRSR